MLLVITSCIKVDEKTPFVTIRSESDRIKEYVSTILWAVDTKYFDKIIFCDNSNVDFESISEMQNIKNKCNERKKSLELYSFQGNREMINKKGKGYGEAEILEHVWEVSKTIRSEKFFYKITGRLTINNIDQLRIGKYKTTTFRFDVLGENVDTRFYQLMTEDYKNYFVKAYTEVDDYKGRYLEYVYYDILTKNKIKYGRFNREIEYRGKSGTTGIAYKDEYSDSIIKRFVNLSMLYNTEIGRKLLKRIRKLIQ